LRDRDDVTQYGESVEPGNRCAEVSMWTENSRYPRAKRT
jgi:hypothetical protein